MFPRHVQRERTPARWARLPHGCYLTRIRGLRLRIIDAQNMRTGPNRAWHASGIAKEPGRPAIAV